MNTQLHHALHERDPKKCSKQAAAEKLQKRNIPMPMKWTGTFSFITFKSSICVSEVLVYLAQGDDDCVLQKEMADCHDTICSDVTVRLVRDSVLWPANGVCLSLPSP